MVGGNTAVNLDVQRRGRARPEPDHPDRAGRRAAHPGAAAAGGASRRSCWSPPWCCRSRAALGVSALVFKHVFGFGGADTSFPLFVFVFLVALGIDYNIFLMTRVREEAQRHGTRRGALIGLAATGGVITSAGLVLAGTFAVLGTLPLVVPRRDRLRGRVRRAAGHDRGPLGAGHRAQPRHRPAHLVAEPAGPQDRRRRRRALDEPARGSAASATP